LKYGKECSIQTQSTFDIEFIFVVYTDSDKTRRNPSVR